MKTWVQFGGELVRRFRAKILKRKGLLYIGWQGRGNIGDDSIYLGIKTLRPNLSWFPLLDGRKDVLVQQLGLDGVGLACQAALGGGTLISTEYYRSKVQRMLDLGLPVWCCGTGVGSCGWEQEDDPDLSAWIVPLNQFKGVGIRGPLSFKKLTDMGVRNVEVVGDLALALTVDSPISGPARGTLAVNVSISSATAPDINLVEVLAGVARQQIKKGWRILPLAMDTKDLQPLHEFCRLTGLNPADIIFTDPQRVIQILTGCTALVGVRLHSAVLAACAGIPPVLIGYRPKCLDFMMSLDLAEWHIRLSRTTGQDLLERAVELINSSEAEEGLRERIHSQASRWKNVQKSFIDRMIDS